MPHSFRAIVHFVADLLAHLFVLYKKIRQYFSKTLLDLNFAVKDHQF